jgi:hypothetical protein
MAGPSSDPVFTRHADGSVTVDQFPSELRVTPELLGGDGMRLVLTTRISFRCANGWADYVVTRYEGRDGPEGSRWLTARLVASDIAEAR